MAGLKRLFCFAVALCLLCSCSAGDPPEGDPLLSGDVLLEPSESSVPPEAPQASQPDTAQLRAVRLAELAQAARDSIAFEREALDAALSDIFLSYGAVGGSVSAFAGGETVYSFSFGFADREKELPATKDTKYRAASVSKVVTTLLCLMETERGGLSLDDNVLELLGGGLTNPFYPHEPVTLEQLLTHTSGFYDGPPYQSVVDEGGNYPPLSQLAENAEALTCGRPGEKWVYTNFGMGLASGALEAVGGERFSEIAQTLLFAPMELDAGFTPDNIDDPGDIANIYLQGQLRVDPREWLGMDNAYRKIPIGQMYLLGQGELYISSNDFARVLSILAGDGTYAGRRYLSELTLEDMHRVRVEAKQGKNSVYQALGVREYPELIEGRILYGHEGQAYGMVSGVFYERGPDCGVVVLTNGCSSQREPGGIKAVNAETVRLLWKHIGGAQE